MRSASQVAQDKNLIARSDRRRRPTPRPRTTSPTTSLSPATTTSPCGAPSPPAATWATWASRTSRASTRAPSPVNVRLHARTCDALVRGGRLRAQRVLALEPRAPLRHHLRQLPLPQRGRDGGLVEPLLGDLGPVLLVGVVHRVDEDHAHVVQPPEDRAPPLRALVEEEAPRALLDGHGVDGHRAELRGHGRRRLRFRGAAGEARRPLRRRRLLQRGRGSRRRGRRPLAPRRTAGAAGAAAGLPRGCRAAPLHVVRRARRLERVDGPRARRCSRSSQGTGRVALREMFRALLGPPRGRGGRSEAPYALHHPIETGSAVSCKRRGIHCKSQPVK